MKYFLILLAALVLGACSPQPTPAPQQAQEAEVEEGCTLKSSSNLVTEHKVSPIRNLVKDKEDLGMAGRCTVRFDITVDGVEYHLEEVEEGLEQLESLCYYARERARKDLLLDLGGEFKSESSVACKQHEKTP